MAIAAATPLIALDVVVLDTETTGLDVQHDRIVQIGAVRLTGENPAETHSYSQLVNPGVPIPKLSSRVHGIDDADVANQPGFAEVVAGLVEFIAGQVVVGHSIHFDLAMLRHEARRHKIAWTEPRVLDIAFLAAGLDRELVDNSLDSLALGFGVSVQGRHTALGDARTTAAVYQALLARLQAQGIRTLGEAETLARRPVELIARQEQAGWFDRPGERPDFSLSARRVGGQRAVDSFLYRQRLSDVMTSPVVSIGQDASLHDAARRMKSGGFGCLFVETGSEPGILTERDVLRVLAERGAGAADVPVAQIMSVPVLTAPQDTFLYRALGLMARRNLRYLGVTDECGHLCGIFTLRTLLRDRALATLSVGDEISGATSAADLARVQAALPGLAAGLLTDGLEARAVASLIAAEARAMTARAAELAEAELVAAGAGPAPADYALLVLGSGGRGESLLAPDQDNALIIADSYAGDLDSADDWFSRFAHRLTEILDQAGIPLCKGGVMARNRPWRRRLSEWTAQLNDWAVHPNPQALLNVDIFYDFAPVQVSGTAGAEMVQALRDAATDTARTALPMLRAMAQIAGSHPAPLGMFGRIRKDDSGRVDLKSGALLAITSGGRVMALRHGIAALTTPERLLAAANLAERSQTDAQMMADAHGFVLRLILSQQITDLDSGIKPSSRVEIASLNRQDHDHLRDALGRIDLIQDMLRDMVSGV